MESPSIKVFVVMKWGEKALASPKCDADADRCLRLSPKRQALPAQIARPARHDALQVQGGELLRCIAGAPNIAPGQTVEI